jgi:hypothetical protein
MHRLSCGVINGLRKTLIDSVSSVGNPPTDAGTTKALLPPNRGAFVFFLRKSVFAPGARRAAWTDAPRPSGFAL